MPAAAHVWSRPPRLPYGRAVAPMAPGDCVAVSATSPSRARSATGFACAGGAVLGRPAATTSEVVADAGRALALTACGPLVAISTSVPAWARPATGLADRNRRSSRDSINMLLP